MEYDIKTFDSISPHLIKGKFQRRESVEKGDSHIIAAMVVHNFQFFIKICHKSMVRNLIYDF